MKGWYKAAAERAPPPAPVTLKRILAQCIDLYLQVPPPGENILVSINPFQMEDLVPTEGEIEWVVRRLQNNCSRVLSGIREEHLKG